MERERLAMRVSRWSILWNVLLSAFKLAAGVFARSGAMLSDAVHSASDVVSTVVVMIGVRMAGKAPDRSHPYGHERMECLAALLLAGGLLAVGLGIGAGGVRSLLAMRAGTAAPVVPGRLALAAAGVSIAVKEAMFWYTRAAARKTGSGALMADAWHHRSDALSSVGSFAGVLGARMGHPALDPLASVVICAFIVAAAVGVFCDSAAKLTDRAADEDLSRGIRRAVEAQDGVRGVDSLNTRLFGERVYVDVEIRADASATLAAAHEIAQRVHDAVEAAFPRVKHCMVHVNPDGEYRGGGEAE